MDNLGYHCMSCPIDDNDNMLWILVTFDKNGYEVVHNVWPYIDLVGSVSNVSAWADCKNS